MKTIAALRNQILQAKHAYYFGHSPIMSDAEYDSLEDQLRVLSPDDEILQMVGSPVPKDSVLTKARHSMPMGSQNKVNSEFELRAWHKKNNIKGLHASLKGDGGSAAAYYQVGRMAQAITRGDGEVGEDITSNALRFKGLPAYVGTEYGGFTGSVRFEAILTVADWEIVDSAMSKNPRNVGNGILGRKNGSQSDLLTIFAFDIDEVRDGASVVWDSETQKSQRMAELGFNLMPNETFDNVDDVCLYFAKTALERNELPFWIDGVVLKINDVSQQLELGVTGGCPKGQIAWKFDSSGAETVLESVVISGGHTGGLFPTAKFRPVEIGGTTVSSALLANFDEIDRLGLAIGDSIFVVKKNDIIPGVVRVIERPATRQAIPRPSCCPFCGSNVGHKLLANGKMSVILFCLNPDCEKKSTGKIGRWISSLDILGIGDTLLEALIDRFDLEDAAGLYTLHERRNELALLVVNVDRDLRFGEKRTATLLDAIDGKRQLSLSQFLGSLGLKSLGKRRAEQMIAAAGGELSTLLDWRTGKLRDARIAALAGVPNLGDQIADGIDTLSGLMDRLFAAGVTITPTIVANDLDADLVTLKTVCISGSLPSGKKKAAYKDALLAAGYDLLDDVVKGLTYLVLADPASTSGKAQKAKKLGINVISEEQMQSLLAAN